jgi:predicted nucleic acid-binding protein
MSTTVSKRVFIATSAFLAFLDRANPKHVQASAYFQYFAQEHYQLYTGFLNLAEVHSEISEKISGSFARDFLNAISLGTINILYPEPGDMKVTLKTLINYRSTDLTFKEAQMAVIASRRSVHQICTFEYLHSLFGLTVFYLPL